MELFKKNELFYMKAAMLFSALIFIRRLQIKDIQIVCNAGTHGKFFSSL